MRIISELYKYSKRKKENAVFKYISTYIFLNITYINDVRYQNNRKYKFLGI